MIDIEDNGNVDGIHGGLLCDEMGLGKTVQTIALMLSLSPIYSEYISNFVCLHQVDSESKETKN